MRAETRHQLDAARPIGHTPDEAALLQRLQQTVDIRFGLQTHMRRDLVEGRRDAALGQHSFDNRQTVCLPWGKTHCHKAASPFGV
jgi:hypothetical protein